MPPLPLPLSHTPCSWQVKKSNFQVACQRHFEITHPGAFARGVNADGVGNHPNAWTAASMEYHSEGGQAKAEAGGGAEEAAGGEAGQGMAAGFTAPAPAPSSSVDVMEN